MSKQNKTIPVRKMSKGIPVGATNKVVELPQTKAIDKPILGQKTDGKAIKIDVPPAVIEDQAAVFKLCMLESDLEKLQLKMQLEARQAAEQIQQIITRRDANVAKLNGRFQSTRTKHIQFKEHIEAKYGICLKHYLYDDEMGTLTWNEKLKKPEIQATGATEKETPNV